VDPVVDRRVDVPCAAAVDVVRAGRSGVEVERVEMVVAEVVGERVRDAAQVVPVAVQDAVEDVEREQVAAVQGIRVARVGEEVVSRRFVGSPERGPVVVESAVVV
jgi:hypothetical protein